MTENKINLAKTAEEAAVLLFHLGFTPIKVVGKNPAYGEGTGWQKTHFSAEADVRAHFKEWNGNQLVPDEDDPSRVVERHRNVGVLCDGFVFLGCNTQETLEAFKAECPFYSETLMRVGNNPYECAIFRRINPKEKFWSGQKILTNEKKPRTMADIWGNGNQFVAWGVHPKGVRYRFVNDVEILPLKTEDAIELVARVMHRLGDGYKLKTKMGGTITTQQFVSSDMDLFSLIKRKVRMKEFLNVKENRMMCPLHKQGSSNPAAVIYESPDADYLHCHSGGCHADVITLNAKMKNIGRMDSALELAQQYKIEVPHEVALTVKDQNPENEEDLILKINGIINRARIERKTPDRGKIVDMIGHFLEKKEKFRTPDDTQVLYRYNADVGLFCEGGETWVHSESQKFMDQSIAPELNSCHLANEVAGLIKRLTFIDRDRLEPPTRYTPLANGIYDFQDEKLIPFTPELFFTTKLAVNYNPEAKCPAITKFFSEITVPGEQEVLFELAGYILRRENPLQKAWLFDGTGNNGKSLFIRLLEKMIGKDSCCSVPIQKLESNRFAAAELDGKYLSSVADLSGADLTNTGMFKAIVGGDMIQAERKGQNPFRFYPWAKLVYSCNKVPDSGDDDSNAFFRRWILTTFPNDFSGREDRQLELKITTQEELSGLLNEGLAAMKNVFQRGSFTGQKSAEALRLIYVSKSNSVKAFLACVEHDPEAIIPKNLVWRAYFTFCKSKNLTTKSEKAFWQELKPVFDCDGKKTLDGVKDVRIVRGLTLKSLGRIGNIDMVFSNLVPAYKNINIGGVQGKIDGVEGERKKPCLSCLPVSPTSYHKIRFLKPAPRWIGADGKTYGPFDPGQDAELLKEEAILLIDGTYAVKIGASDV